MDDNSISITISSRISGGEIKEVAACWDRRISLETLIARAVGDADYRFSMQRSCSFDGGGEAYRIRSTDVRNTSRIPRGSIVYVGHLPAGVELKPLPHPKPESEPIERRAVTYFNEQPSAGVSDLGPSAETPRYDAARLAQHFDRERRDGAVGAYFDPYGLINHVPPARTASPCRSYAELQKLDINPLARWSAINEEMAVNWIWMGSPYDPGPGPDLIRSFIEAGGCRLPILWTDLSSEVIREGCRKEGALRRMLEWCAERGVRLLNIDDVFCGEAPMTLQPLFNLARLQRQWGLASDILRLEILHRFGGIYSDVDNECLGELRPELLARFFEPEVEAREDGGFAIGLHGEYPCNAFVIAKKNSAFLMRYIEFIRSNFRLGRRCLCEQAVGGRCEEYEQGFVTSTEATVHEVVARTGPYALAEVLLEHLWGGRFAAGRALEGQTLPLIEIVRLLLIFRPDRVFESKIAHEVHLSADPARERLAADHLSRIVVPRELVKIRSSSTWLARRVLPCSDADQARIALTSILFHLVNNPPVLDLTSVDHGGHSVLELLQVIGEHYPELMSGVREAWVPDFYPDDVVSAIGDRLRLRERARVREIFRDREHDAAWILSR
jgi:hypothetical protein